MPQSVSRTSRARGYEPRPQDATPRSTFRIVSRRRPHERGCESIPQLRYVVNRYLRIVAGRAGLSGSAQAAAHGVQACVRARAQLQSPGWVRPALPSSFVTMSKEVTAIKERGV